MRPVLITLALAVMLGYLLGGRLSALGGIRVRWAPAAIGGLAMQLVSGPGRAFPLALLYASFVLLLAFAVVNIRTAGFVLIAGGIVLNFAVIAVNQGMPVSRDALEASGQHDTLAALVEHGGAKHHLASPEDNLVFLGDVIAVPPPVHQAISAGDIVTYLGVCWMIVAGMRRRDGVEPLPDPLAASGPEVTRVD